MGTTFPSRASRGSYLAWLFRRQPELRAAYQKAVARFGRLPGVCGIGVGRRFHESRNRYAPAHVVVSDYCLKIFVQKKIARPRPGRKIPRTMKVRHPRSGRFVEIELDVVSAHGRRAKGRAGQLQGSEARGWPTAGSLDIGRLFAFTKHMVTNPLPGRFSGDEVDLGTVGALVRSSNGDDLYAVSASHVFVNLCNGETDAPDDDRAIGVLETSWAVLPGGSFRPLTVAMGSYIRDALAFRVPSGFRPTSPAWPAGFTGELATQDDIDRAIAAQNATGFVWVERHGQPAKVLVDLEAVADPVTLLVACDNGDRNVAYIQSWCLNFKPPPDAADCEQFTLGGDSGSGVFLWADDPGRCRLLGFHFYRTNDKTRSYAVDARWFLSKAFGSGFGTDCVLAT